MFEFLGALKAQIDSEIGVGLFAEGLKECSLFRVKGEQYPAVVISPMISAAVGVRGSGLRLRDLSAKIVIYVPISDKRIEVAAESAIAMALAVEAALIKNPTLRNDSYPLGLLYGANRIQIGEMEYSDRAAPDEARTGVECYGVGFRVSARIDAA